MRCRLIAMHGTLHRPEGRSVRDFLDVICAAVIVIVFMVVFIGYFG